MKKVDKEFLLTDETVNCYGYRLLTTGLQLERFEPPIGFFMHDRELGVAVKWEDLVIRDGALYGKPVVDEKRFPDLPQQIMDGFYAAASVGHIVALEISDEPELKVEGQTGPTVTKWFPRECSIVDIPGNYNAVAQQNKLFDEGGNVLLDLTDKLNPKAMNKVSIEVEKLAELNLPNLAADSTAEQALNVIRKLAAKAEQADKLEKELKDSKTELANLKEKAETEEVSALVEKALADHKINQATADKLKADYKGNAEGLKSLLEAMPAQTTISDKLKNEGQFDGKSWDELDRAGKLAELKSTDPARFAELYKAKFGVEPKA